MKFVLVALVATAMLATPAMAGVTELDASAEKFYVYEETGKFVVVEVWQEKAGSCSDGLDRTGGDGCTADELVAKRSARPPGIPIRP